MAISASNITSRFPSLQNIPEPVIDIQIELAQSIYCAGEALSEPFADEAITLCVAHFLTMELMQQAVLTGISTGVSKGEAPALLEFSGKKHWELTVYGLQFQDLMDFVPTDNAPLITR